MKREFGKTAIFASAAIIALALTPSLAAAQEGPNDVKPSLPLLLKGVGSFFVGGNTHHVDSPYSYGSTQPGEVMINQMYVQFMKPLLRLRPYPIIFVHGCCLSSKSWQTTPDGRMGWDEYFVRKGFDVYLADQVGRARSGFNGLQYQKVRYGDAPGSSNPEIRLPTDNFAWNTFRWGDFSTLTPYSDERFPMSTVGVGPHSNLSFYKQVIPDMTATLDTSPPGCSGGGCYVTEPGAFHNTSKAMSDLANDLGGAILVGHSQSSSFPTLAALQQDSHSVKGIIQLETGCFGNLDAGDINILKDIPILIMEADHYPTARPAAPCPQEIQQITDAGGDITYIHLPDIGIHGNSHMMMLDNNNLQIADILIKWIEGHVGRRRIAGR
jgi:pimeloyl-ACP methyl ester carboxylesterase